MKSRFLPAPRHWARLWRRGGARRSAFGSRILAVGIGACVVSGCSGEDLPGNYYDVTVAGSANSCTGDGTSYNDSYEYRLELDVQDVQLSIGDDLWAAGSADGCLVTYQSIVWEEPIDDYLVKWQIQGQARVNTGGGSGCVEDGDWAGSESFVILSSDHPDISAGCTYDLDVTGTWLQEI